MWLQSRNSALLSFKNRFSVFPLSLNTLTAHDGRTRGAETNLQLFYPMFVFPQAVPQHMLGTSQTAQAAHTAPRRSFSWKPCRATLSRSWKSPCKDFLYLWNYKWREQMLHSSDALPPNLWNYTKATVSADQKLGIYVSQADVAELYFTGIFYLFPLEYGGCAAACAGRGVWHLSSDSAQMV